MNVVTLVSLVFGAGVESNLIHLEISEADSGSDFRTVFSTGNYLALITEHFRWRWSRLLGAVGRVLQIRGKG